MLKITLHQSALGLDCRLEGKLTGLWVSELRRCWQSAAATPGIVRTVVDLRDVDFVDAAGEELLREMSQAGVEFHTATPFMQSILEKIERTRGCARVKDKPRKRQNAVVCADPSGNHPRAV